MKVSKQTNPRNIDEIHVVMTVEEAELTQTAVNQFAENIANKKSHQSKMRRLAMLIDKALPAEKHERELHMFRSCRHQMSRQGKISPPDEFG